MSSHPGSTLKDAIELALFLKSENLHPEQVQDFYPTPGTVSTCMFYTGIDPYTMEKIYVPKTPQEKAEQRALLQYFRPVNKQFVLSALKKAGRYDLIGRGKNCLVADDAPAKTFSAENKTSGKKGGNFSASKSGKNGATKNATQNKHAKNGISKKTQKSTTFKGGKR